MFGRTFSDHMFEVDWNVKSGWDAPLIRPYGPLSIDPAASSLHYALQVRRAALPRHSSCCLVAFPLISR